MPIYQNKNVLVLGLGLSGISASEFLLAEGAQVWGSDHNVEQVRNNLEIQALTEKGLRTCSEKEIGPLANFDFVVLSPGIPPSHSVVEAAMKASIPVIGEIELGCRNVKNRMIGITGTNGKTTVTLLVAHVLNQCGHSAKALGNVEVPITRELLHLDPNSIIALELSSYQIETFFHPSLDAGLLLNITPDHLDRYGNMEAYAAAKCALERNLKQGKYLYVEENAWCNYGSMLKQEKIRLYGYSPSSYMYTDLLAVFKEGKFQFDLPAPLKNRKSHDLENLLAAYSVCSEFGVSGVAFINAYQTFSKPSHRIEFVAEANGICFYDDSKGTNLDAVIRALQTFDGKVILIAGGVDKGAPYTPWVQEFKGKVKLICAIGQAAGKIHRQIGPHIAVLIFNSLDEAVEHASACAVEGDIVLLSPGCASYDMFKNYAHRGEEFQRIVHHIIVDWRKEGVRK